ncbi:MAG: permease [Candidatus Tyrphobacter sp.]
MVETVLLIVLGFVTALFAWAWIDALIVKRRGLAWPRLIELAIGFVTDFFDTLGIGSFAPTTSFFKLFRLVPDERIPGTLNIGHTLPTVLEAVLFIGFTSRAAVEPITLVSLIAAAVLGAWLGAGFVARWPRHYIQIGMGTVLLIAAALFVMKNLNWLPGGGHAHALFGLKLWIGVVANFCLGALMTIGIGLYAPAMMLVALLGMEPAVAFPIMMGSCAFLMPSASIRFIRFDAYSARAALGLTVAGLPGVYLAWRFFQWLPITAVRWLVVVVVVYAAIAMLRSAMVRGRADAVPVKGAGA